MSRRLSVFQSESDNFNVGSVSPSEKTPLLPPMKFAEYRSVCIECQEDMKLTTEEID